MALINAEPSLSDTINLTTPAEPREQTPVHEVGEGGDMWRARTYVNPVFIEPPSKSRKNKELQ